jgi:hypothetical protein
MFAILRLGIVPLIFGLTCAACEKRSSLCEYLADGYPRLDTDLNPLPILHLEQVPNAVVSEVQKCWAAHPYGGPQHSLLLQEARKTAGNGYYLVFQPRGIEDVELVFRVNGEGRVTAGYQSSTL